MTELERFAAALLAQWRAEGGAGGGPIEIAALMDRTLPYRTARRLLGIDVSEDYEALVMRLIAGEGTLAQTEPEEAGEMARTTLAEKLPDLDLLKLLRTATIVLSDAVVERLADAPFGGARAEAEAKWRQPAEDAPQEVTEVVAEQAALERVKREPVKREPKVRAVPTVIQLPTARDATRVAPSQEPLGPPPAYLTGAAAFTPPGPACWSCNNELPADRTVKYCTECGADQRAPTCAQCGEGVERAWKHCAECGAKLTPG